jgi:hypothetical protein
MTIIANEICIANSERENIIKLSIMVDLIVMHTHNKTEMT